MRRFMLFLIGFVLLAIVAVAVLLPMFLDEQKILQLASDTLKKETGATLTVGGDTSLSLFPTLGIALGDAAITMPDKTEPDLTVGTLQIGVQTRPLLSGEVVIDTFTVDGLTARVVQAPAEEKKSTEGLSDEQLDAFYDQRHKDKQAAGEAAGAEAALAIPLALNVRQLSVSNAEIQLVDSASQETTRIVLERLRASDLNLDGTPIPVELDLALPGEQPLTVQLQGQAGVAIAEQLVQLQGISVTVSGATAQPLTASLDGPLDLSRQSAQLQLQLASGEMRGTGTLRYASFESPQIDADLSLNQFDPALFALAGPEAAQDTGESAPTDGDAPLPLAALRDIDTAARLNIETARFGAHTITNVVAGLRAVDGVIDLHRLTGEVHGGGLLARATFNARHNVATLDTKGGVGKLDIARALEAAQSATQVTGTGSVKWELTSRGTTSNELIANLVGNIDLDTDQIVLHGTSVEHLLCQAVALTNQERLTATFAPETRLETLSADVRLDSGKARLQPLKAELRDIGLSGRGDLDLLSMDFSATFAARLSPGLEELDRACRVSKRLTAIDWPVNCRGNAAGAPKDWCKVDTEKIIRDLTVNEGRRKLEKEAGKFLNKLFKQPDSTDK